MSSEPPLRRVLGGFLRDLAVLLPRVARSSFGDLLILTSPTLAEPRERMRCSAEDYDRGRALMLARAAESPYFRGGVEAGLKRLAERYPRVEVVPLTAADVGVSADAEFAVTPIAVIAIDEGGEVVVAVRGTQGLVDMVLQTHMAPAPGSRDLGAYALLARPVLRTLRRLLKELEVQHVWVTGHSMGGAVATLVTREAREYTGVPVVAYTFAGPASLATSAPDVPEVIRLRLAGDFVPAMFEEWYRHAGHDYLLCADRAILKLDGSRDAILLELVENARLTEGSTQSFGGKLLLAKVLEATRRPELPLDEVMLFDPSVQTQMTGRSFLRQHGIARYIELLGEA